MVGAHMDWLSENFRQIETYQPERSNLKGQWTGMQEPKPVVTDWETGLPSDVLKFVGAQSVKTPTEFNLHPQLKKTHVEARMKKLESGTGLDWGTCEALPGCDGLRLSPLALRCLLSLWRVLARLRRGELILTEVTYLAL